MGNFTVESLCPKPWSEMAPTEAQDVRHCDHCDKDVFEAPTADRFRELAAEGKCVTVPHSANYDVGIEGTPFERAAPRPVRLGGPAIQPPLTGRAMPYPEPAFVWGRVLILGGVLAGGAYALGAWLGWWPWGALPWGD